ncbi:hypothetical protein HY642_07030 [Candidatus Woesearchaeota archaeon]|nr:hypothetical protein [Candidatus Woesearchaeota archaeon]
MIAIARTRALGGSLVVTVPKEVVREEGLQAGELVHIEVEKMRKSFFGAAKGVGHFSTEDELKAHD